MNHTRNEHSSVTVIASNASSQWYNWSSTSHLQTIVNSANDEFTVSEKELVVARLHGIISFESKVRCKARYPPSHRDWIKISFDKRATWVSRQQRWNEKVKAWRKSEQIKLCVGLIRDNFKISYPVFRWKLLCEQLVSKIGGDLRRIVIIM